MGTVLILAVGATAVESTQDSLDVDRSEKVMTQLDSQIAMVALGNSQVQQVPLPGAEGARYSVDNRTGWMNVSITNATSDETEGVMNATLGAIQFSDGERTVAYQGGGVWKGRGNESIMVSPPEFYYRDATLTLPLVTVTGEGTLDGQAVVSRNGSSTEHYPDADSNADWVNPLEDGVVDVTVHSDYYRAWGTFFEQRTAGTTAYDHENETATLTLIVPAGKQTVSSAVAGTSGAGEISLAGSGSDQSRTDSYDSSKGNGTYADTKSGNGTVVTAGDATVKGNSLVNGTLQSGGFVSVKGSGEVTKDVEYTDGLKANSGTIGGTTTQINGVEGASSIGSIVLERYRAINGSNDNGASDNITNDQLDSGSHTLESGTYHLDEIHLDGETLTLDTGDDGDPLTLAVKESIYLENDAEIKVNGTSTVRVYMNSEATGPGGYHIDVANGEVNVTDGEKAPKLWIYGKKSLDAAVSGSSSTTNRFEGVIYAPAGGSGVSSIVVKKGEVFGGVVVGDVDMENGAAVHYDNALENIQAVQAGENVVHLTYLHISHNPVSVAGR